MFYFFSFLFMLISTKGSFISYFDADFFLLDGILIIYGLRNQKFKKSDFRLFFKFCAAYILFVTFRDFALNQMPMEFFIGDLIFLIKYMLLAFLYCAVLREKAAEYLVKITVVGAVISLFFYTLQLVAFNFVFSLGSWINLLPRAEDSTYSNFIFFTLTVNHHIRNCGFTWEPGAFGCILNIGLLLHLVLNGFKFDRSAKILLITIITTLSTTSYITLMIILLLAYRANGGRLTKFLFIAVPAGLLIATQLPFMVTKIVEIYNRDLSDIEAFRNLSRWYLVHGGQLPLNRFGSFIYLYDLYGYKLIWGITNAYQDYSAEALRNVNISNGLIDYVAKFGVIGLMALIYFYSRLFKKFMLNGELIFYCVLVLLLLSFGEPYLIWISTMAFFFLYYYTEPNEKVYADGDDDELSDEYEISPAN